MTGGSVTLPDHVQKELEEVSKSLDISEDKLIDRAVMAYLDALETEKSLQDEFAVWDRLSDEALASTET